MHRIFTYDFPWVMPEEPPAIREIFTKHGREASYPKGAFLPHGGPNGTVSLLVKGLVTFSYVDINQHYRTLSLILPGRTVGDLDSLDPARCYVIAECLRPSKLLCLSRRTWLESIRSSVETMEMYAQSANLKHQCTMEGMIANYTQQLDFRLCLLIRSVISSYYEIKPGEWNPMPVALTITDLARVVASTRSWVSRRISAWQDEGKARRDGRLLLFHSSLFNGI